ncbi:hypothetical protein GOP47_0023269 [Adiantum capillus-veneris]|uniref:Ornithine cyclodeaminase n=1 Tax=Adiantum capillus-veneris TaxID=13818 RepID=A0A9D4U7U1_ADICA|nr:hypothetical protein GOP47_0023269 [Adiantum capillus-veneris]
MEGPRYVDAAQISSLLSYAALIDHLRLAFKNADTISAPPRLHYTLPCSSSSSSSSSSSPSASPTLLLMPAWPSAPCSSSSSYLGVKLVTVFPHNASQNLPSVSASYLLSSALTGLPLAFLDGKELTLWRTACVSALASQYLSRSDARILLMVGAGALAPHLIKAHCAARPLIQTIFIWNRTHSRAQALAQALGDELMSSKCENLQDDSDAASSKIVSACTDLEAVTRNADIICCATLSEKPLVQGSWLKPGTHLDLVGSFAPNMRECDEDAIRQATVVMDTPEALQEAGELVGHVDVATGTLSELIRGEKQGRLHTDTSFTVFKSVGCALVDLAAAQLVYEKLQYGR